MYIVAFALSALAVSLSIYSTLYLKKKIKQQEDLINEYGLIKAEDVKIEPLKAKVRANSVRTSPGNYTIKIFNVGPAIARNVKIEFNPVDFNDLIQMENFPYPYMEPQDSTEVYMNMHNGMTNKIGIKMQWDDDNEFNNEHTQVISL